jgi:hypothetical protein
MPIALTDGLPARNPRRLSSIWARFRVIAIDGSMIMRAATALEEGYCCCCYRLSARERSRLRRICRIVRRARRAGHLG